MSNAAYSDDFRAYPPTAVEDLFRARVGQWHETEGADWWARTIKEREEIILADVDKIVSRLVCDHYTPKSFFPKGLQ